MITQDLRWTNALAALVDAYVLSARDAALKAYRAHVAFELDVIESDSLWADLEPELFVMPRGVEHCESCGGDLREGRHEVRVDVDEWRCFTGGRVCGFEVC
jgi:hypothetical protein